MNVTLNFTCAGQPEILCRLQELWLRPDPPFYELPIVRDVLYIWSAWCYIGVALFVGLLIYHLGRVSAEDLERHLLGSWIQSARARGVYGQRAPSSFGPRQTDDKTWSRMIEIPLTVVTQSVHDLVCAAPYIRAMGLGMWILYALGLYKL